MTVTAEPMSPATTHVPMPVTRREHVGTVLCGLWMTVGLFLDGYFHQNLHGATESFVTPWHAVFYAGFGTSVLWIGLMSRRRARPAFDWRMRSLPPGYDHARVGIALFALGGIGDALWHTAFGVEKGVDALLSPTHLLLFVGLVLVLTAPIRAAHASPSSSPGAWVLVGSLTSTTALIGFFLNFVWGLGISEFVRVPYDAVSGTGETQVIAGVASMLVATAVLFGAARVLRDVGVPPLGSFTVLFGSVALLVSAAFDEDIEGVLAAVIGAIVLEFLDRARRLPASVAFAGASAALWLAYFALLFIHGVAWQTEIWLGAAVLNTIAAAALGSTMEVTT